MYILLDEANTYIKEKNQVLIQSKYIIDKF